MNTGIIASRYAAALLRYTQETGGGERVCAQVRRLLDHPDQDPGPLEPELERFIQLLVSNGRLEDVRFMRRAGEVAGRHGFRPDERAAGSP